MEAKIGVALAVRITRGCQLTPAGMIVAEWSARLLDVAHEIEAGIALLRKEVRARITVAASQTISEQLMPHRLLALQAEAARRGDDALTVILTAITSERTIAAVRDGSVDPGSVENPASLTD